MARKRSKKTKESADKEPAKKIVLPAYGLAEEILGGQTAKQSSGSGAGSPETKTQDSSGAMREEEVGTQTRDAGQSDTGEELHLVTFSLDREEYGVEIGSVQEIIRVGQITSVPNAPDYVQGVINLRGRVLPVLNLRKKFQLPEGQFTKNSRIMVVESTGKVLGILVDGVSQVVKIPLASVEHPPSDVEEAKTYVKGIGKMDSRLIMIMDMEKVLMKESRQATA